MTLIVGGVLFVVALQIVQWGTKSIPHAIVFVVMLPIVAIAMLFAVMLAQKIDETTGQQPRETRFVQRTR